MPFLTNAPLPQCLQHSSATRRLLARDHDRGCMRHLLEVKCLDQCLVAKAEENLRNNDLVQAFTRAWDLYRDSLDDNSEKIVREIENSFKSAVNLIIPINLDDTIGLLKEIGYRDKAIE